MGDGNTVGGCVCVCVCLVGAALCVCVCARVLCRPCARFLFGKRLYYSTIKCPLHNTNSAIKEIKSALFLVYRKPRDLAH